MPTGPATPSRSARCGVGMGGCDQARNNRLSVLRWSWRPLLDQRGAAGRDRPRSVEPADPLDHRARPRRPPRPPSARRWLGSNGTQLQRGRDDRLHVLVADQPGRLSRGQPGRGRGGADAPPARHQTLAGQQPRREIPDGRRQSADSSGRAGRRLPQRIGRASGPARRRPRSTQCRQSGSVPAAEPAMPGDDRSRRLHLGHRAQAHPQVVRHLIQPHAGPAPAPTPADWVCAPVGSRPSASSIERHESRRPRVGPMAGQAVHDRDRRLRA